MRFASLLILMTMNANGGMSDAAPVFQPPTQIQDLVDRGSFTEAQGRLRALADGAVGNRKRAILFEIERLDRIRKDFPLSEAALLEKLREQIPDVTGEDVSRWREAGVLDARVVEGVLRYDGRTHRNLFRLSEEARRRRIQEPEPVERKAEMARHIAEVIPAGRESESPYVLPQRLRIEYTLSVKADAVPAGEIVRCWLLYPHEDPSQRDIRFVASTPGDARVAPDGAPQRTVYLERPAEQGKPTVFSVTYEYKAYAFYRDIDPGEVRAYDTTSGAYREFTAERPPHIVFTPEVRAIAREAVGDETNPYLKAKRIFDWIDRNVTYTWMWEYSTVPNLSGLCATRRRGDCGVQGLLFITLCRVSGVPARWESGWTVEPWGDNMHDWVRFYVEPFGWLWADPSRGYLKQSDDPRVREFYFGNKDRYRMATNSDYSARLDPPKEHFRSETVDFQRGEVEWRGGNLYFDQWNWEMKVTPLEAAAKPEP